MGLEVRLVVLLCLWWASQTEGASISMGWILVPPSEFMSVWPQRSGIPNESVYADLLCRYVENRQGRESGIQGKENQSESEGGNGGRRVSCLVPLTLAACLSLGLSCLSCLCLVFFLFFLPFLTSPSPFISISLCTWGSKFLSLNR